MKKSKKDNDPYDLKKVLITLTIFSIVVVGVIAAACK
jgi:hypothetical protein